MLKSILKALREKKGVSLKEVGIATGMHYEYINLFERMEKFPDKKQLKALEKYYKTDLKEYFLGVKVAMLLRKARRFKKEAAEVSSCRPEDLWK